MSKDQVKNEFSWNHITLIIATEWIKLVALIELVIILL